MTRLYLRALRQLLRNHVVMLRALKLLGAGYSDALDKCGDESMSLSNEIGELLR